ncbi:hypothetical protein PAPYR_6738 [Paratrimastix pyriformis]|uniref:Uncharacterized protein n=1 Tax=Paratrimastix pyriformis TaxID=342808 RepID=A0ABQ8UEP0_9EUKA|nr:hypothetical protein PAPYR_6738 [Paratrimastix pyriformis]
MTNAEFAPPPPPPIKSPRSNSPAPRAATSPMRALPNSFLMHNRKPFSRLPTLAPPPPTTTPRMPLLLSRPLSSARAQSARLYAFTPPHPVTPPATPDTDTPASGSGPSPEEQFSIISLQRAGTPRIHSMPGSSQAPTRRPPSGLAQIRHVGQLISPRGNPTPSPPEGTSPSPQPAQSFSPTLPTPHPPPPVPPLRLSPIINNPTSPRLHLAAPPPSTTSDTICIPTVATTPPHSPTSSSSPSANSDDDEVNLGPSPSPGQQPPGPPPGWHVLGGRGAGPSRQRAHIAPRRHKKMSLSPEDDAAPPVSLFPTINNNNNTVIIPPVALPVPQQQPSAPAHTPRRLLCSPARLQHPGGNTPADPEGLAQVLQATSPRAHAPLPATPRNGLLLPPARLLTQRAAIPSGSLPPLVSVPLACTGALRRARQRVLGVRVASAPPTVPRLALRKAAACPPRPEDSFAPERETDDSPYASPRDQMHYPSPRLPGQESQSSSLGRLAGLGVAIQIRER